MTRVRAGGDRGGEGRADGLAVRRLDLRRHDARARTCFRVHVHAEGAVVPRVDRHALDGLRREGLEVHGAVDAAEDPEVGVALGAVDRGVRRLLADEHLELLARAEAQQGRDVVAELVEGALVLRPHGPAVDPGLGVGHRALEDEVDALAAPRARGRRSGVDSVPARPGAARGRRTCRCRSPGAPSWRARGSCSRRRPCVRR